MFLPSYHSLLDMCVLLLLGVFIKGLIATVYDYAQLCTTFTQCILLTSAPNKILRKQLLRCVLLKIYFEKLSIAH